jgi:signal transduction histidine kinase
VDYLLKPIVPEVLLSKVSVFVELCRKTEQVQQQAAQLEVTVRELQAQIGARQRTEDALRRAHEELERRVEERTARLVEANEALRVQIAERERAEQERAQMLVREQAARADAEAAVRLRDQFLSIASHELKTPLTALHGNIQLIQRRVARGEPFDERNRRLLDVLFEQAARFNRLIDAMLDISRIQTGQLALERGEVDVDRLARRVVSEMQQQLEQHRVRYIGGQPAPIEGDELRLEQVLQNLLHNAVKYSPDGGEIVVRVDRRAECACIAVTDQGIGIPQHALPRLGQRFYRADNADSQAFSGLGIGLYVVNQIVALHGGRMDVASTEGQGSTFTVTLPAPALTRFAEPAVAAAGG